MHRFLPITVLSTVILAGSASTFAQVPLPRDASTAAKNIRWAGVEPTLFGRFDNDSTVPVPPILFHMNGTERHANFLSAPRPTTWTE